MNDTGAIQRILVVDDSRTFQQIVISELKTGPYVVDCAESGAAAIEALRTSVYDLITLDVEMPGMDGFETCRRWRAAEAGSGSTPNDVPIVIITSHDTQEGRRQGFGVGVTEFLSKHFTPGEVRSVVDRLLQGDRRFQSMTVLAVDDSRTVRMMVQSVLRELGCRIHMADSGEAAVEILDAHGADIDLVLCDQHMPGIQGEDVCHRVRSYYGYHDVPFIFLSGSATRETILALFRAGATDYIPKPFIAEEFRARLAAHLQNRMLAKQLHQHNFKLEERVAKATADIRGLADDLRTALEQERRLSIEKEKMGRFLSPSVVDEIQRNRERALALGGRSVVVTVLFSDICGFSQLAEGMAPTELIGFLNQYMTAMTEPIQAHGGIIDKFVGDGIMAVFSDGFHDQSAALRSVRAGACMQTTLDDLRNEWRESRPHLAGVQMRVGINTGSVVAGNIGSETRMDYTVIGDSVNIASRIETACEPGSVLISDATFNAAGGAIPVLEDLAIQVKNRDEPVQVKRVDISALEAQLSQSS